MEYKTMYLQALRDQNPEEFKRLSKSGQLMQVALMKAKEASALLAQLTKDIPENDLNQRRMVEEVVRAVRAQLLDFPQNQETTDSEDEMRYLFGEGPLLSPDGTT